VEHRVRTKYGEAAFSISAVHDWNKLPQDIRSAPTVLIFKSKLKTFLFSQAYD